MNRIPRENSSSPRSYKNILTIILFIIGVISLMYSGKDMFTIKKADICVTSSDYATTKWLNNVMQEKAKIKEKTR